MPYEAKAYIESHGGMKWIMERSSIQQNRELYEHFPKIKRSTLSKQKTRWIKRNTQTVSTRPKKKATKRQNIESTISPNVGSTSSMKTASTPTAPISSAPDDSGSHSPRGGLQELTEAIFEDALCRVLQTDPAKALGPALSFLDKKKQLSVEDEETSNTLLQLDKLKKKRDEMFV